MDETQTTLQILGIIAVIASLFGWLLKHVFNYFTKAIERKDLYIEKLVEGNQKNVEEFTNVVNHQQTKFNASIDYLSNTIKAQTEVFEQLIKSQK